MEKTEREFVISENVAQVILEYLASRPYREVFELIAALQSIKPLSARHNPGVPKVEAE